MKDQTFYDYLTSTFCSPKSGTAHSYRTAIIILDDIFKQNDVFKLNNTPLCEIKDPSLIAQIVDFIADEEEKFRKNKNSIFDLGKPTQKSYPAKRFCTGAIRKLRDYVNEIATEEAVTMISKYPEQGNKLSRKLIKKFHINAEDTEKETVVMRRIGQDMFRAMLMKIYGSKCCLTGLDVPEVLRASHILPWSEDKENRLNPENGLCLSATYDAAFDKHLISFDEDYRLILSSSIKDAYSSEAFKTHFLNFEGRKINLPTMYIPSQEFLGEHRKKIIC